MDNIENITTEKLITGLMAGLTALNISYAETEAFNRFLNNTFKPVLDAKLNSLQEENTRLRAYVDRKLTHHLPSYQELEEKIKQLEKENKPKLPPADKNTMTHTYTARSGKVLKCKILEKLKWFTIIIENENKVRVTLKRWDIKKIK